IRILQKIVSRTGSSKVLSFAEPHVLKALQILLRERYVSRKSLCKHLQIGEGAVKTLILHLKREGLADSVRAGTFLTKKENKFVFPGEETDCLKSDLRTRRVLFTSLRPHEGDVIILVSANDPFTAEIAAKNSALFTIAK